MTLDKVSKNAFVEPFSAPQNYVTNHPREFTQQPNLVLQFCGAWVYRQSNACIRIVDTFDILGKKLPLVTISVKGWRHSRPSKDIVNHNICVTTAGGVW